MAKPVWASWVVPVLLLALAGLSLSGHLGTWVPAAWWASLPTALGLAAFALLPTAFYALALERDKAAPALRSALAPWVSLSFLHAGVQWSGGASSPLWAAYPLLILLVARHASWWQGLGLATAVTALEGFPLWQAAQNSGVPPWPGALALGLPWLGLALAQRKQAVAPAPVVVAAPVPSAALRLDPSLVSVSGVDALVQSDIDASLDLVFHSHPGFNALSMWWGSPESVQLRYLRLRQGQAAAGAEVLPGDGHLGLVLRNQRSLDLDPVAPSAAAGLPYVSGPYAIQALKVLPLSDEGRLVGLLCADKTESSFSVDEGEALKSLGNLLVQHVQRAEHLRKLLKESGRSERLYDTSKTLSQQLDREALLGQFGGLLQALVPCDSWALGMREDEAGALQRVASQGYAPDAPPVLSLDRSSALAATLTGTEDALLFNREPGATAPGVLQEGLAQQAQHFLLAPLRTSGRLTGVLKLDRLHTPFSKEDREIAYTFASHAAVTLEHARLYSLHKRLATTDGLTELYNHRYFQERLGKEIEKAAQTGKPLSLALTDIDFFKKFNDSFGHQEGDVVLKKVARLVEQQVRPGKDVVCRYGGEEFVVILPDCDVVEARLVMDRVREFSAANLIGGQGPEARPITMSVGISTYPQAAKEQRDLIHSADEALYKAKHSGRNRVCSHKDL